MPYSYSNIKGTVQQFVKYTYPLSLCELDEKTGTTHVYLIFPVSFLRFGFVSIKQMRYVYV